MKKTKQILIGYLTIVAFLLTTSCEKEDFEEHTIHESNIKRERVNFLKFRENENAFKTYEKLNENIEQSRSQNSRSIDLNTLDFEINFNNGLHLTYHNLESYTFPIRRVVNNGLLENIVISEHTDGKYYAKLLKYNLTAQERINLAKGELKSIQNPIITEVLGEYTFANRSGICYESVQVITSCGAGVHHGGNIGSWGSCTSSQLPSLKTITIATACDDNQGGGGSNFNYGFGTGNGSGGYYGNLFTGGEAGGPTGYISPSFPNDSTPIGLYQNGISEPVLDIGDGTNPLLNSSTSIGRLLNFLTEEQANFFFHGLNGEAQISILNYIDENTDQNGFVNSQAREFVKEAINTLEEGGEVDFENEIILELSFINNLKIKCVYDKLMQTNNFKDLLSDFLDDNALVKLKFKVVPNLVCGNSNNPSGCTNFNPNTKIATITISEDYIQDYQNTGISTPLLFLCEVILHESIHANLFYNYYQYSNNIPPSNQDFTSLYESYRIYKDWQHNYIASNYIYTLVSGLSNVHELIGDENFINTTNNWVNWNWTSAYESLIWPGLIGTTPYINYMQNWQNWNDYYNQILNSSTSTPNCN